MKAAWTFQLGHPKESQVPVPSAGNKCSYRLRPILVTQFVRTVAHWLFPRLSGQSYEGDDKKRLAELGV